MSEKNINMDISAQNTKSNEHNYSSHPPDNAGFQKYLFEFGDDDSLYSGSFSGKLTLEDIRGLLKFLHGQTYKDCPEAILSYLRQQQLEYSHFKAAIMPLEHEAVIKFAENLLKSPSCSCIEDHIDGADNYYAVTDHQIQVNGGCEGCYYAIRKTMDSGTYSFHIIGQTFACDKNDENQNGYFAIRSGGQHRNLRNLDDFSGEPIFPSFGYVDIFGILMDIDSLNTAEQIKKTAVK